MATKQRIGIWGLGVVGTAAVKHFYAQGYEIEVMDKKIPADHDREFLQKHGAQFTLQHNVPEFLARHDHILASPGIDLIPFKEHAHKWVTELDILQTHFKKPIIAITGSVGKTTTTHLLGSLLNTPDLSVWTGGNIGTGMLDLLQEQEKYSVAVLELSSFQLEHCKEFAPRLAIWTNLYPNHLDRHGTLESYFNAKTKILSQQSLEDTALVPLELKKDLEPFLHGKRVFFLARTPRAEELAQLGTNERLYFIEENAIWMRENTALHCIVSLAELPPITFVENWLVVVSAMNIMGVITPNTFKELLAPTPALKLPADRLEYVAHKNGVTFYNDSKSTHAVSTLAACTCIAQRHYNKPVHLFLGGLSKGVDRTPLIEQLAQYPATRIYTFGKEAEELKNICQKLNLPCDAFADLEQAFESCMQRAGQDDVVLLSPAGSSYDLYTNYHERGNHFKKLVQSVKNV